MGYEISRGDVIAAYRLYLAREPESEDVISEKLRSCETLRELRNTFVMSDEFREAVPSHAPLYWPRIDVDVDIDESTLTRLFERIKTEWSRLGTSEPYWSVLSDEHFKISHFEQYDREFFESGQEVVRIWQASLERNGISQDQFKSCLELGCGVGRVTRWLAPFFERVIGLDISINHIELAKDYLAAQGVENVSLRQMADMQSLIDVERVDSIFSILVLQHNPPPLIAWLIKHLLSKLRQGGVGFFQVPTYAVGYSFKVDEYLSKDYEPGIEMHLLPQVMIFQLIEAANCTLIEMREDGFVGLPGWISNSMLVRKKGP